jgi:2-polyprenyl-3-methyl-5-hydroxy-6-metoxy-1,4-benzoquinol methylase
MSSSPCYLDPVVVPLVTGSTVLDAGCGYGRWCHLLRSNYWEAGMTEPPLVDGFDAFAPNVELCRSSGGYRRVWQQELPSRIDGEWDTVLACEIIEHLPPEVVASTLEELERVARKRIVVTTPNAPALRGGLMTAVGFNPFEAHLSHAAANVFKERGYRVIGAGWGRPGAPIVRLGYRLGLAPALQSVPRILPRLGETLVAVRDT